MRAPDWDLALSGYLEGSRLRAWRWGAHDCLLFCAGAVHAMTGQDYAAPYRDRYSTRRQAMRLLAELGGDEARALAQFFPTIAPASAQRGDLAIIATPTGIAAGVCVGGSIAVAARPCGWVTEPLASALTAYRVMR